MSVILESYKDRVDKVWYDSSNVVYSECYDYENALKDLKVVFKEGRTYLYKSVNVNDYVLFKRDLSQGKALHKYIIKNYEGLRLSDIDMNELEQKKQLILKEKQEEQSLNKNEEEASLKKNETLYHIIYDKETEEVILQENGKDIFKGINGEIDLFQVIQALGIKCSSEIKSKEVEK